MTGRRLLRYRLAETFPWVCRFLSHIAKAPPGPGFRVLLFHDIRADHEAAFERLLRYLLETHGVITPAEAEDFLLMRKASALFAKGPFLLTFDDGFKSHGTIGKKILDRYGVKAVFFVCPGLTNSPRERHRELIARYILDGNASADGMGLLSWFDIDDLAASGHTIGSHTSRHRRLSTIKGGELREEVMGSADLLKAQLGTAVKWFAYPFGDIDSIDPASYEVIGQCYEICCSGIRGSNLVGTHPLAVLRDPMDLTSPVAYQDFISAGGLDFYYRTCTRKLRSMVNGLSAGQIRRDL